MIAEFVDHLLNERHLSPKTGQCYSVDVELFQRFLNSELPAEDQKQLKEATTKDVQMFVDHMTKRDYKPRTINRKLASLGTFYRFLKAQGIVTDLPIWHEIKPGGRLNIRKPKTPQKELVYISIEQARQLLGAIQSDNQWKMKRDKAIYGLIVFTGLRASEVQNVRLGDVDLATSVLKVRRKRIMEIALTSEVYSLVESCYSTRLQQRTDLKDDDLLFVNKHDGRLSVRNMRRSLKEYAKAVGIQVNPAQLRHSFAVNEVRKGTSAELLQKQLGHISHTATKKYLDYQKKPVDNDLGPAAPVEELEITTNEVTTCSDPLSIKE